MANTRKITDTQVTKILKLWGDGYTREEIAKRFGVTTSCIAYYIRQLHNEKTVAGYIHRKYQLLTSEEYDKVRIFYHLKESVKYMSKLTKRLTKRLPELGEDLEIRENKCKEIISKARRELEEALNLDWKEIEKDCKEKWREYEKECRKKTGHSSMDRLYRVKGE